MTLAVILLTAFINLLLGLISYLKNPLSATHRLLTALTVIFAAWTIANYFSLNSATAEGTLFWIRAVMFITAPLGPVLYLFIRAFPNKELQINKTLLNVLIGLTLLVQILAFTPFLFSGVTITGEQITPTPGPGIILFAILFMGIPIIGIFEIIKKYRRSTGVEKQQLKFLVFGISLTFTLLIITNFVFVLLFKLSNFVIFGPIFSLIFVVSITYSIIKHRLLAIRLILARSVAYAFLIAVLASIYTLGIFFLSRFIFQGETEAQQRFTSAILAVFIVLTFEPIKNAIQRATDHVFFRGKYNSDEVILDLTTIIASNVKLKDLTQKTLHKLLTTLQIEKGAFIIYRKQNKFTISADGYRKLPTFRKEAVDRIYSLKRMVLLDEEKDKEIKQLMHQLGVEIAVPLSDRERSEGLLVLGSKKSGEMYTPQDIKILEIFGPVISIAIQNGKSYEEIKSFNKTLSDRVTAATKELQDSHAKLQTLDKQKDKFLGMASHELKTPITSIKAFSQVLYRKIDKKEHPEYGSLLENINSQTDKVTKLINDLLNVSNIEEGKLVLKKEQFSIDELVAKTISDMQYTTDTHKIVKEGTIKTSVYGDADRLMQVLSNLLTNAIKYSPKASKVTVELSEQKGFAKIAVRDFGPGIAKEDQQKIFDRFYRTKFHEERNIAGFGLGLYIAAEIIKRHNGDIGVSSVQSKGSTFYFTIPLYDKSAE
jgi:signal transduction histidine kinase